MSRKRRLKKSNKNILISIISLSFLLCLSIGYSALRENLNMSFGVGFSPHPKLMVSSSTDESAFRSSTYKLKIKSITIEDEINVPDDVVGSWDISEAQNDGVIAYVLTNEEDSSYYDLYIQGDETIRANEDMSYWFANLTVLEEIRGTEFLETSKVTTMEHMFYGSGFRSTIFDLDLSSWDTSNVIDMSHMFTMSGVTAQSYSLDLSGWDTSNVTNMDSMFMAACGTSTTVNLDLSGFDTSNVTNMHSMFDSAGLEASSFILDVSHFDTSSVTDMSSMFDYTGSNSSDFITSITISNPNVLNYAYMFNSVATKGDSKITVNYTSETSDLVDLMIATKTEGSNVVKGERIYLVGEEISIADEVFNVISDNGDTVTMLAQYNLGTDYRQSTTANLVNFSASNGWEYISAPKEIDIQKYDGNVKTYVNEYVSYLSSVTGDDTLVGDLISLSQLENLGCSIPKPGISKPSFGISYEDVNNCDESIHKSWILNGNVYTVDYEFWTKTASYWDGDGIFVLFSNSGGLSLNLFDGTTVYGSRSTAIVRPTITISKETLKNIGSIELISFTIGETTYQAEVGMTFEEWINSDYSNGDFAIGTCDCERGCYVGDLDGYYMFSVNNNELAITDPAIGTMPYANEIEQDGIYSLEYWGINSGSCLLEDI